MSGEIKIKVLKTDRVYKKTGKPFHRPKTYTDEYLDDLALSLKDWVLECYENDEFRMLYEWCQENDFHPQNFTRYTVNHEGFKEAYHWAKAWQEFQVVKGALTKKVDPRFAQFYLGCQHNWRSKDDPDAQKRDLRNDFVKFIDYVKGVENKEEEDEDEPA